MQAIFGDDLQPLVPQHPSPEEGGSSSGPGHELSRVRSLDAGLVVPSFCIKVRFAPLPSTLPVRLVARPGNPGAAGASGGGGGADEASTSSSSSSAAAAAAAAEQEAGPSARDGGACASSSAASGSAAPAMRILHEFPLSHLPPLRLALAFPGGYPSRCPPVAAIGADWLSHSQLCRLASGAKGCCVDTQPCAVLIFSQTSRKYCASQASSYCMALICLTIAPLWPPLAPAHCCRAPGLLRDWEAAKGEVAVFRWVDWLKENTLSEVLRGEAALLLDADEGVAGAGDGGEECAAHS